MNKPKVGIIGGTNGLGAWFHRYLSSKGFEVYVSGRHTELTNTQLAKMSDIIIISVPISTTESVIKEVLPHIREGSLLMDFTSLKEGPMKCMSEANENIGVVGLHPLFGPLVNTLNGQKIVVCKHRPNKLWYIIEEFFKKEGAKLIELDPKTHDKQMAYIQALTHFYNIAYMKTLKDSNFQPIKDLTTPVFTLQSYIIGRIFGQNPELYADIEMLNPEFRKVVADFEKNVSFIADLVLKKDRNSFISVFSDIKEQLDNFIKISELKTTEIFNFIDKDKEQLPIVRTRIRTTNKIGYLGPRGTHTHQAVMQFFDVSKAVPYKSIYEIFKKLSEGDINMAVVPAENTYGGFVGETFDNLISNDFYVKTSFLVPIVHHLFARVDNLSKIKKVVAHPQALSQCSDWLRKNLPDVELIPSASNASDIDRFKDKDVAFIGNELLEKYYDVQVIERNIQNKGKNVTEFYVVSNSKKDGSRFNPKNTLFAISIYDRVGILRDILTVFQNRNINLTKIFSRPSRIEQWSDYIFFIEAEVYPKSPAIKEIVEELETFGPFVKMIGGVKEEHR